MNENLNLAEEIMKKIQEVSDKMIPVNIMIIGKTGIGKSTLINSVFRDRLVDTGIGEPVTQHLRKISKKGIPLTIYDTKGLELTEKSQNSIKEEIINEISNKAKNNNEKDFIHIIWFCINSESHRIEEIEKDWIKEFSIKTKVPVIIVLTKSYSFEESKEFKSKIENLNLPVKSVKIVLADEKKISSSIVIPPYGLNDLVSSTIEILPELVQNSFINAQKINIDQKVSVARAWMFGYVAAATGTGFSPLPFSDAFALIPIQVGMMAHITAIFGLPLEKSRV